MVSTDSLAPGHDTGATTRTRSRRGPFSSGQRNVGQTRARSARSHESRTAAWMVGPAGFLLVLFLVIPVLLAFTLAFTNSRLISPRPAHFIGLTNFVNLFQDSTFWASLRNTLYFAVVVVPVQAGLALAQSVDVSAVFASNDQMALGLLRGFHSAGVRVPGDVSVVGFDDIPESEYFWPPLTTVRPDYSELGRRCMALLLDQLTGNPLPPERPVVPELTVRDSTARPRS